MIRLNGEVVEFGEYPNGETVVPRLTMAQVRHASTITLSWESDRDLVRLLLLKSYMDDVKGGSSGVVVAGSRIELVIDYMPYSRMDRAQDGHAFSLEYVAYFIRQLRWASIRVVEPHSDETLYKLGSMTLPVWATAKLTPLAMEDMGFDVSRDYLVMPDKGAHVRYSEQLAELFEKCNVITLAKTRDFETGKILGLEVASRKFHSIGDPKPGAKALIIDDLSSRGGTFVQAYRILRHSSIRCSSVSLLVTHMEPVGLTGELATYMDKVYCTDTMPIPEGMTYPKNFHVFDRSDWL